MGDDNGRGRALLTPEQREYLRGEREPSQERTYRTRLRERIHAGLRDFEYLADPETFSDEEIEIISKTKDVNNSNKSKMPVFREGGVGYEEVFDPLFGDTLIEIAAFLFRASPHPEEYERIVAEGRTRAERRIWDPEDIAENIEQKIERGEQITDAELRFAVAHRVVPLDDLSEHIETVGDRWERELEDYAEKLDLTVESDGENE